MAKKITGYIKLQVPAGAANPSPPIGPALGQRGLNIMEFCKAFNAKTQDQKGYISPSSSRCTRIAASVRHEDPAHAGPVEEGPQAGKGIGRTEP